MINTRMFDPKLGNFSICSFSTEKGIIRAAKMCQSHATYSPYGAMRKWVRQPENIKNIIFLMRGGEPIGTLVILKEDDYYYNCNCGTWVYPEWRRNGVGRHLMRKAIAMGIKLKPWTGSYTSANFYNKTLN